MIKFLNFFNKKDNQEKFVIIRTDGGICSQIAFCVLGFYMQDLGYKVKYDLSWFKDSGVDCLNRFVRNYDMEKAFPDLKFEIATSDEIKHCIKMNVFTDTIPLNGKSGYLCGYAPERDNILKYKDIFIHNFKPIDIDTCRDILTEIEETQSCAVHVRRGDLSVYNPAYGYPTPKEYYIKAINIIHKLHPQVKFFFFSEECDWIKEEIIPNIDSEIKYKICDKNGADKGYLDLYLMSKSDHLIASSGSLAKTARILSNSKGITILDKYDKNIVEHSENVIVLNDTILLNSKK